MQKDISRPSLIIKASLSAYFGLAVAATLPILIILAVGIWGGGVRERLLKSLMFVTGGVLLWFLPYVGYLKLFRITLYSDRVCYRYSLIKGTRCISLSDIQTVERTNKFAYGYTAPILKIYTRSGQIVEMPLGPLKENDIVKFIKAIKKSKSVTLNEWAEETRKGEFKDYYHYTKAWKQILFYGLTFVIVVGILNWLILIRRELLSWIPWLK